MADRAIDSEQRPASFVSRAGLAGLVGRRRSTDSATIKSKFRASRPISCPRPPADRMAAAGAHSRRGSTPGSHMPTAATAVTFDLGGVMIDWDPRHLYRKL